MMIFGWLILGGVIYYANIKTQSKPRKDKSVMELLDYRYAKGEMDEDTYLRMKRNIEEDGEW
ncbi:MULTISPECIES: hypothetical protein [unclassified Fusibacter]|uniref:hypothetical protein n=1 Tax=unclassified Fusibacter TaxID=2624464 RepID=UPI0010120F12|nr:MULTISPECIES: hypothetical protein [unclassified Fusibacter]MCK8059363.1 hypothetical protein [Fusibacter sp. A2]NPE21173.1 hypothetical protein [Fusibacter sp. A1]RXV62441.1 hypothetical protein DWB64_05005 [Fusibacter sp. A1]